MPTFAIEVHNETVPALDYQYQLRVVSWLSCVCVCIGARGQLGAGGRLRSTFTEELSIVITQVYNYRELFEEQGIQGGRMNATESSKGEFVRLMLKIDITKEGESERVLQVIEKVLKNLALRVPVEGKSDLQTPVGQFLAKLRDMPNMHFV